MDESELGRMGGGEDRKVTRHILQDCGPTVEDLDYSSE